MNTDRPIYGRLTVAGNKHSLGHAPNLFEAFRRAAVSLSNLRVTDAHTILIELSFSKLADSTILDRETQLLHEMKDHMLTDPNIEIYPGVPLSRMHEAMMSPEYDAYNAVCQPDKRIGLDPETILQIKKSYEAAWPDCYRHFPLWVDS